MPVVLLITLVAAVAWMLNNASVLEGDITASVAESARAEYVAQAGLQHAVRAVQNSGCAGDLAIVSTPFGADSYQATVTTGATTNTYTLNVDQDTWLKESAPGEKHGSDVELSAKGAAGDNMRTLYRFDLGTLPGGATISSAIAWFYVSGNDPDDVVNVHEVTTAWTEATADWATMGGQFDSTIVDSIPPQPGNGVWVQVNLTNLVQGWVNGNPNNGIMLVASPTGNESKFASREWSTASERPRLEVVATSGSASPVTVSATGTLANGVTRTLDRVNMPAYQTPATLFLQPDAADGKDTWLTVFKPTWNYGNSELLRVRAVPGGDWRSMLRFDIDGVPHGVRIQSATLELYKPSSSNNAAGPVNVHAIGQSWVEGTNNACACPGSTWNERDDGLPWNDAGGDYDKLPAASTHVDTTINAWYSWDVTGLLQEWTDGTRPNHGFMLVGGDSVAVAEFASSDNNNPVIRPRLTIQFACECGTGCLAPQGTGTVLMVVVNPTTLVPADAYKQALFESWGYTVAILSESANQASYDTAIAAADVVYISETVNATQVGTKLQGVTIGVVSQDGIYNDDLGFAAGSAWPVGRAINITDTSHYITSIFPAGLLDIYSAGMEQLTVSGTEGAGLQTLADTGGAGSLVVLDSGALGAGGTPVPGRRVMLPLGRESDFNWNYLNNNGRLLVQRALQWGTGNTGGPPKNLLLVVVNPANLTAQEDAKKALIESWGYTVNLIDESDTQANFDAAIAANDVAYIPQDINSTNLGTKLRNATIGVVNEEGEQVDELGIAGDKIFKSNHEIDIVDNSHYITQTFATGLLTFVSSDQSVHMLSGDIAPGLLTLARSFNVGIQWNSSLAVIETGDALDISGTAAGRRVQLPWGGGTFDINQLNADGQTLMQRAIEWAEGAGPGPAPGLNVLLVVGDAASPASKDAGRKALLETWGHTVTLIDDGDSQANFDAAAAVADVVYVSGTVGGGTLADKLTSSTTGLVSEFPGKLDNFGFSSSTTSTVNADAFSKTDPAHYITQPFSGNPVTVFTGSLSMPVPGGTLAPDLSNVGEDTGTPALVTLDAGAEQWDSNAAPARRVHLPFATAEASQLTADGETILQRALEWAAGAGSGGGGGGPPPAGPVYEEYTETIVSSNTNSITIAKPPGTVAGDLLVAAVATDGNTAATLSPPGGWNLVNVSDSAGAVTLGVWWRLADGSEGADFTFNWTGSQHAYGWIGRISGHDPVNPINATASGVGTSASPTSPAVTTTANETLILRLGGFDRNNVTPGDTGLSAHTSVNMVDTGNGAHVVSGGSGYLQQPGTGSSGTANFALTSSEQYVAVTIAVAPPP